ncbi:hypothetical protein BDF21DRAFT_393986 [Thamnidium elegans]|nr:hypothetical protein BDF21DRAFT_393986 [Thamnidium elegans]
MQICRIRCDLFSLPLMAFKVTKFKEKEKFLHKNLDFIKRSMKSLLNPFTKNKNRIVPNQLQNPIKSATNAFEKWSGLCRNLISNKHLQLSLIIVQKDILHRLTFLLMLKLATIPLSIPLSILFSAITYSTISSSIHVYSVTFVHPARKKKSLESFLFTTSIASISFYAGFIIILIGVK